MTMDTAEAYALAVRARGRIGVDSSRLRGSTTRQAQDDGAVVVEKYNQPVALLTSIELFDELLHGVEQQVQLQRDLPLVAALLTTALKLGVTPERAVRALISHDGVASSLDITALAEVVENAADDLDAAVVARDRLSAPESADIALEVLADELGVDLDAARDDVAQGRRRAQIAT